MDSVDQGSGNAASVQAVRTTGIYCRPDCSARPDPRNVTTFPLAAAAEAAGFRACHRCRPYRDDRPLGEIGPDLVCRAVGLIVDGALDDAGEDELAARVGVSTRHLRRLFDQHLGASPDALARSRRAHFARRLLDDTDLPVNDVAFAAGFGSVRQFQRACQEIFHDSPSALRARRRKRDRLVADGGLELRLGHRGPVDADALFGWLSDRAIPGVECVQEGTYRRTVLVEGRPAVIELRRHEDQLLLRAHLPAWHGLIHLVRAARRLCGLDLDVLAATEHLATDPTMAPLLRARPGLRPPGTWDPFECTIRAVLGQQVSVRAARTFAGRLVARCGEPVEGLGPMGLTHTFPTPSALARCDFGRIGLTGARASALGELAGAVASGSTVIDDLDPERTAASLSEIRGIGAWTAQYVALRMGDPDAFPAEDLVLRDSLARLLGGDRPGASALRERAEVWRPWRAVAATHLWNAPAPASDRCGARLARTTPVSWGDVGAEE